MICDLKTKCQINELIAKFGTPVARKPVKHYTSALLADNCIASEKPSSNNSFSSLREMFEKRCESYSSNETIPTRKRAYSGDNVKGRALEPRTMMDNKESEPEEARKVLFINRILQNTLILSLV